MGVGGFFRDGNHVAALDGGGTVNGGYNDAHERRAVAYDNMGNGLVFCQPLLQK